MGEGPGQARGARAFLKAIEADALGSERDEPSCLRFNVLRDQQDPNVYYFFEVYRNETALERTGQPRTMRFGGRPQTLWTGRPRRRVAILYFLLPSSIGKNANSPGKASAEEALMRPQRAGSAGICDYEAETNRIKAVGLILPRGPQCYRRTDRRASADASRAARRDG